MVAAGTWATIATLLQTAKMNCVDPQAWLTQMLERLAKWLAKQRNPYPYAVELKGLKASSPHRAPKHAATFVRSLGTGSQWSTEKCLNYQTPGEVFANCLQRE
jgi:hypothetical protein